MEKGLTNLLETSAADMGCEVFGVASVDSFADESYRGNLPTDFMPDAKSVIVIGVIVPKGAVRELPKGRGEYTNTLFAGTVTLRSIAFRTSQILERKGYSATIVPTEGSEFGYWYADRETLKGDVSIKYAGYLAGLGRYGINNLLLLPDIGPRIRMTAVVTDAELEAGTPCPDMLDDYCRSCQKCVDVCPAGALHADGSIDPHKCKQYMFEELGGLRCGLCVKACLDSGR